WHEPAGWTSAPTATPDDEAGPWATAAPEAVAFAWAAPDETEPAMDAMDAEPVALADQGLVDEEPAPALVLEPELEPEEEDAWWEQSDSAAVPDFQPAGVAAEARSVDSREH